MPQLSRRQLRRYRPLLGLLILAGSLIVNAPSASAAVPAPQVIGGQLTSNGVAVSNADLILYPIDNAATIASLPDGTEETPTVVGAARTDAQGNFHINLNRSILSASFIEADGSTTFELTAATSTTELDWFFTAFPYSSFPNSGWITAADGTTNAGVTPTVTMDLAASTAYDPANDPAQGITEDGTSAGSSARASGSMARTDETDSVTEYAAANPSAFPQYASTTSTDSMASPQSTTIPAPCVSKWLGYHYNIKEHFMNVYAYSDAPATVTEGVSSGHSLGAGFSTDAFAHMSADGSASVSTTNTHTVAVPNVVNATIWNRVNYRDHELLCHAGNKYLRIPVGFYDLMTNDYTYTGIVHYAYCSTKVAGTSWSTGSAKDASFAGGVSVGPISLSAQSGYGSSQDITYTYVHSGHICGNNSAGPLSSSLVDSQA